MKVTFGPTEFLKAIADDIEQVAKALDEIDIDGPLWTVSDCEIKLRKIISTIRDYTSDTKVTTIAGTTVISTTTDDEVSKR